MPGLALIFALCLALTHLGASRFSLATAAPRSRWLSLAGGTSVAYVFVHILPELKKGQDVILRADLPLEFLEHHVYIVALLGFVTFYGLERLAVRSRRLSQVVNIACDAGAVLVLISDAHVSTLSSRAQALFVCPADGDAVFDSYVGAISLVNYLVSTTLSKLTPKARARMAAIEQAHAQLADLESSF